jgi:hypothetical protein
LKVAPNKCFLFQIKVNVLGDTVSEEGVKTEQNKIEAITKWTVTKTVTETRAFLGTAVYYRSFIKSFAQIARPLLKLTDKDAPLIWTDECMRAFLKLKEALTTDSDASSTAIGALCSQIQNNVEKVRNRLF